jgi:hypothetical protein
MLTDLTVLGLGVTLVGAGIGAWGVLLSPQQAVEIGVMRINGNNTEEDLRLPAVQNLLHQSQMAALGFVVICVGTGMQIAGTLIGSRKPQA